MRKWIDLLLYFEIAGALFKMGHLYGAADADNLLMLIPHAVKDASTTMFPDSTVSRPHLLASQGWITSVGFPSLSQFLFPAGAKHFFFFPRSLLNSKSRNIWLAAMHGVFLQPASPLPQKRLIDPATDHLRLSLRDNGYIMSKQSYSWIV